jgi:organic radical activating enzyme
MLDNRRVIEKLDLHVADSCNLRCEQCDHFSNLAFKKVFEPDTLRSWCEPWSKRIRPLSFHILGGEPLMNKNIVEIIYLMRELWTDSHIVLWSNGLLAHQHPDVPRALKETNTSLQISNHSTANSAGYDRNFDKCIEVLKKWYEEYEIDVTIQYNNGDHIKFKKHQDIYYMVNQKVNTGPDGTLWERFYRGYGKDMKPYNDGNPELSWTNCSAKCPQLYGGRIHKCAPLTFLPLVNEKFGLSEEWNHYLTYKGLSPECSDDQLDAFLGLKAESFCGMCPTKRPKFKSQLNPYKLQHDEKELEQ